VGAPLRERVSWFLLFHQTSTADISTWSSISSSETQSYLDDTTMKSLLYKLWAKRILNLTSSQ
jgi:hypothetical protein